MADFNKVMLIGRLTCDPEIRTFPGGGKMATFRFAVNNRKKNIVSGEWEKVPCFIDCKANNKENGRKLADTVEKYLFKGDQVHLEGHLVLDEWDDKETGKKNQKLRVMVDSVEFLEPKNQSRVPNTINKFNVDDGNDELMSEPPF